MGSATQSWTKQHRLWSIQSVINQVDSEHDNIREYWIVLVQYSVSLYYFSLMQYKSIITGYPYVVCYYVITLLWPKFPSGMSSQNVTRELRKKGHKNTESEKASNKKMRTMDPYSLGQKQVNTWCWILHFSLENGYHSQQMYILILNSSSKQLKATCVCHFTVKDGLICIVKNLVKILPTKEQPTC